MLIASKLHLRSIICKTKVSFEMYVFTGLLVKCTYTKRFRFRVCLKKSFTRKAKRGEYIFRYSNKI